MEETNTIVAVTAALVLFIVTWMMFHPQRRTSLRHKHVVVTGAASGIGRGLAIALCEAGAVVSLLDVNKAGLGEVAAAISQPERVHIFPCDVSDYTQVETALSTAVATSQRPVEILINNAGIVNGKKFVDLTPTDMQRTMQVNTMSQFFTTKVVLPAMLERHAGLVVTVSSVMGLNGASGLVDYCASKFALVGFHEALRLELNHTGVRTLLVCPMAVASGMFNGIHDGQSAWHRLVNRYLLPMINVDDAVRSIIDAIQDERCNELVSCAPCWRRYVLPWAPRVVRLLPVWVMDRILGLAGATDGMDTFVGRAKVE
ncbi:hypothetical protein AaE_005429 [Aphanomyces astaci]|uniref:Ketoreductase domain-containing protein n=1 Tax=Aphanomyces astaci TaxID=112090 RepID=A0A6A5A7X1_APHAT|nr:hypothetical protein AaE_005429 [Aphanomyces astaci]